MTTSFHLELDNVHTYGALYYQLGRVLDQLKPHANEGEIVFPELWKLTTVLSDEPVGTAEIRITSEVEGFD